VKTSFSLSWTLAPPNNSSLHLLVSNPSPSRCRYQGTVQSLGRSYLHYCAVSLPRWGGCCSSPSNNDRGLFYISLVLFSWAWEVLVAVLRSEFTRSSSVASGAFIKPRSFDMDGGFRELLVLCKPLGISVVPFSLVLYLSNSCWLLFLSLVSLVVQICWDLQGPMLMRLHWQCREFEDGLKSASIRCDWARTDWLEMPYNLLLW